MSQKKVYFGLIGTGAIAQSYASAFENHPEAKLVAVADTRWDAAEAYATKAQCAAFGSVQQLLEEGPKLDAVIVCTPPDTHENFVIELAQRRLHVLCEKPFTFTAGSARKMIRTANNAGVLLTMASKFRYVEDIQKAKQIIDAGTIGDVILFENAFTGHVNMSQRWNSNRSMSGGGVLIDNGTHSVDIMRFFLGPVQEVHAVEGRRIQQLEVEDTARLFVRSNSGVMGTVDLSWSLNKELDWFVTIYGSQGTLQVGWKQSRYKTQANSEWVKFGDGYNKLEAFRNQVTNFARAIQGEESLLIHSHDALASVEVIEAAYRSLQESHWTGVLVQDSTSVETPLPMPYTKIQREVTRA